jgi:AcrR family transcriptional regulator
MPKLWTETVAAHRQGVRDAILNATAQLAATHGIRAVTMSQIAEDAGIGRATLYKYYPDIEAILLAWHAREIEAHLESLAVIASEPRPAIERLRCVLEAFALIVQSSRRHDPALGAFLHREGQLSGPHAHLRMLIQSLLAEAHAAGEIRSDAGPEELATYCLHSIGAAGSLETKASLDRLLAMIVDGLRGPSLNGKGVRLRRPAPRLRRSASTQTSRTAAQRSSPPACKTQPPGSPAPTSHRR